MATVYILHSEKINRFYIGSCIDIQLRLEEHHAGKYDKAYTKKADDWILFLSVEDLTYEAARKIERHIKMMKSKKYIENLKSYPELLENLKLKFICAGSSR